MRQLFSLIFRSQWRKAFQRGKPKGNHWKALKLFLVIKNGTPGVLDYLSVSGKKLFAGFNQWSDKLYIQHMMQNISKFLGLQVKKYSSFQIRKVVQKIGLALNQWVCIYDLGENPHFFSISIWAASQRFNIDLGDEIVPFSKRAIDEACNLQFWVKYFD